MQQANRTPPILPIFGATLPIDTHLESRNGAKFLPPMVFQGGQRKQVRFASGNGGKLRSENIGQAKEWQMDVEVRQFIPFQ